MPDKFGFDHLLNFHRCIECEWPGYGHTVSENDRAKHARQHNRVREREIEKQRKSNLAEARKAKKEYAK